MISTRLINKSIQILCTKNQTINTERLKLLYRTSFKFMEQNKHYPIIIDVEKNVKLSSNARKMFERLDAKRNNVTLVIVAG